MKYGSLTVFQKKHPELAEIIESGTSKFLIDVRKRIVDGKDVSAAMLKTLRKIEDGRKGKATAAEECPKLGAIVSGVKITVTRVYTDRAEGVLIFEFDSDQGWAGSLKEVSRAPLFAEAKAHGWVLAATKSKAKGDAFPLVIVSGKVTYRADDRPFVTLGIERVRSRGWTGEKRAVSVPLVMTLTEVEGGVPEVDDELPGGSWTVPPGIEAAWADLNAEDEESAPVEKPVVVEEKKSSNPEGERASLLPDFSDWRAGF